MATDAFFLPGERGQRFCLFHPAQLSPGVAPSGRVMAVHAFAEEMNKSRRMAALQSRALAGAGFDVLQIDLLGCGDSSGDFADATWDAWVHDVVAACQWLRSRGPAAAKAPPLWLWGHRAGCLLAAQSAAALAGPCNFLFWAPTPSGNPLLQQFLRLKAVANVASGKAKAIMDSLRGDLARGQQVEIAGYLLAPELARGLEHAVLSPPLHGGARVEWFELSTREDATLTPLAAKTIEQWQQAGYQVRSHLVQGPSFWQTAEIEDAPALIAATCASLVSYSTKSAPV